VIISHGANGCLASLFHTLLDKGDQLVTFEPFFPFYQDHCKLTGAILATVPLTLSEGKWIFSYDRLREALASGKTKVLLLNTPHNPTGKVLSLEEL